MKIVKVLFFFAYFVTNIQGFSFAIDQLTLLKKDFSIRVEHPLEIQETLLLEFSQLTPSPGNANLEMSLWGISYRRYVEKSTEKGVFYSFGIRAGRALIKEPQKENEIETAIMPLYDVGIKARLSDRWRHILRLEIGYLMLYTTSINIDPLIGLQITPSFSFVFSID